MAGENTNEAEAAAQHLAQAVELVTQFMTRKPDQGGR